MKEDNLKNKNQEKFIIGFSVMYLIIAIICAVISIFSIHSNSNIQIFDTELARTQSYNQVQKGDDEVKGTDNVKFDAFFLSDINGDSYAESIRGTCKEIGKEDKIYMELKVQGGNLEDGKIEINGKNFYLQTVLPKDKEIKESAIGSNTKEILLNNMPNGIEKLIIGTVRSGDYTYNSGKTLAIGNNVYNYSKENSIVLTGMYVDETGNKIPIEKEVKFYVDWYGTTTAGISTTTQTRNIENAIDEENDEINLNFSVYTEETKEQLILKNNHVEGEIPLLNGYEPKRVEYIDSQVNFEYDETTRIFSIDKNAAIFEDETSEKNGEIINALSRKNTYTIKVTYPLEAYKELGEENVQLKIPITTYYEGYNNSTPEFKSENPYKSNIAKSTITITYQKEISEQSSIQNTYLDIKVGKNVYDPVKRYIVSKQKPLKIYNGQSEQEKDDTYTVMWRAYIGKNAKTDGLVLKETKDGETQVTDEFIKTNNDKESVDDVVSNIGIYFNGADTLLGENGWIKVYDEETGDLIAEFSKDNWNKYDGSNPYKYAVTVKHVKIVTSEIIQKESSLYVYSVKEIDDEKIVMKYDKEKFDELQYISSTLEGYLAGDYIGKVTHQAKYEAPLSIANISINPNAISTQETEKNATITITTQANENYNLVKWVNGIFLVKLPEEIIDVKINDVSINNDSVKIETYELIEDKGQLFIKIVLKIKIQKHMK